MLARRDILRHAAAAPIATGGLAAVLADPDMAHAAAQTLETVTIETPAGKQISAAFGVPAMAPAPAILLVHEWWGLNDQIKAVAADLNGQGYATLAVDLYDGQVADNPDDAKAYMNGVEPDVANQTLGAWIDWLRARSDTTGKVGTVGWCFGGGWSLNASLDRPVEATVIYYGNVAKSAGELAPLAGPVVGHFATQDQWINEAMVSGFEAAMDEAGKPLTVYWYDANHAFANPTGGNYDEADAALAWQRTMEFFAGNLV
jgi:carboxymethylenebutenolidase